MPVTNNEFGPAHSSCLDKFPPSTQRAALHRAIRMLHPPPNSVALANPVKEETPTSAHTSISTVSPQYSPTPPEAKTTFLDLPSELRNEIYELALVRDPLIYINGLYPKRSRRPVRWSLVSPTDHGSHVYPDNFPRVTISTDHRRLPCIDIDSGISRSLLSIGNSQIEQEASSIFYGMNHFSIGIDSLTRFFDESSIRRVRHLQITRGDLREDIETSFQKLGKWAHVLKMQNLQLSFEGFNGYYLNAVENHVELLWPLVKSLMETRGVGALDMILFFPVRFRTGGEPFSDDDYLCGLESAQEHTSTVREELRKIANAEAKIDVE
ncbi:hypothetical protein AC578_2983 [Pseudocercospora eumusae]|uniref:F-box domain-containing protein n=1 Tax=Pseudocercospora eumusae TaxID=321146 RepID=A0A139HE58_9PEZI|nr:hypothetical protein AC578_2983 [Pseudocercospora eumusae]